ncbi:MAG TPA: heat-inducible transcriptional repressor HrcA [Mycobacteriales bacterium]|nr:heat-inducible transcriptional repressor HrcA [Mycobacteriales bacterium]
MQEDRRFDVLRAIVEDFVATQEPVGSKALAQRHGLGVSPATVRNDMAVLEEEGYITQPHTSAGRIPTDRGYRVFVDRLAQAKPLSAAERRAITTFLEGAVDLDDVVHRSVRLLATLTHQVAVVQYPSLTRSRVRHLELVVLDARRLLVVLITDTGRVEQRTVELPSAVDEESVGELRAFLNTRLAGLHLADASAAAADMPDTAPQQLRPLLSVVLATVLETVVEQPDERVIVAGASNLMRNPADFPTTIGPVLDALEEQVVLLRLLGEVSSDAVTVRIGGENDVAPLQTASVVAAGYTALAAGQPLGGLGVVGPTRMDYPGTIAAVRAVARYVGQVLGES